MPSTIGLGHAAEALGGGPTHLASEDLRRTEIGDLVVPADAGAQRAGCVGGLVVESGPDGLRLAPDVLRKVYVEITSRCNLNCTTCIRQVWDEPLGHMPIERYQRMLAGLTDPEPRASGPGNTGVWGNKRLIPAPRAREARCSPYPSAASASRWPTPTSSRWSIWRGNRACASR